MKKRMRALLLLSAVLGGCSSSPSTNDLGGVPDKRRVDNATIDVAQPDAPADARPDGAREATPPDLPRSDQQQTDQPLLDKAKQSDANPDKALPDKPLPDKALADQSLPDKSPDKSLPDKSPDQSLPDKSLPDKSPSGDLWKWDGYVCTQPAPTPSCSGTLPDRWCTIPAGCFMMGSPTCSGVGQPPCTEANENYRQVTLVHSFEMQATEVTVSQWTTMMGGKDPSAIKNASCGTSCPVENVTWDQAAAYCNALSQQKSFTPCYTCTGTGSNMTCAISSSFPASSYYTCPGYRLPTEAELEYATRAGTTTELYNGSISACAVDSKLDQIGWYYYNAPKLEKQAGAQKQANGWGLYDLSGNVWEWSADVFFDFGCGMTAVSSACNFLQNPQPPCPASVDPIVPVGPGTGAVVRGGSFQSLAASLRSANRDAIPSHAGRGDLGFRCVRTKNP